MKLVSYRRAVFMLLAPLLTVAAVAQPPAGTQGGLNIPANAQVLGRQDPNVRRATAIVNGEVITGSDIDHRIALIVAANRGLEIPADEIERVRAQVLRSLVDETLQIQAAAREEITIPTADVDQGFARYAQSLNQTPATVVSYLRSIGSSERSVRRYIIADIAWRRLRQRQIDPFVNVGEEEVQEIIARMTASRGTREFRVGEIFISATPESAAEARTNAQRIVQQLRQGASFAAYARQFSEASTAAVGGDLGWVRAEQLPPELASAVNQIPVGGISDPIALSGGFSIVEIRDARTFLMADERDAVLSLMQMAIPFAPGTTEAQARTRLEELTRATQNMGGCGNAQATATRLGAELVSNDQVRVRDLPAQLQPMLLRLGIGQATPPIGSIRDRVSVLILCGRDDPQEAQEPSFDQVYAQLNEDRANRRAQRFLRDLRRDAVVEYR